MRLVLVSAAALTLVGGTAVSAQPVGIDPGGQRESHDRGASASRDAAPSRHGVRGRTAQAGDRAAVNLVDDRPNYQRSPRTGRRWMKVDNDNVAGVSAATGAVYQIIGRR